MPMWPSASRTSSSLNGLMMAITSFMDRVSQDWRRQPAGYRVSTAKLTGPERLRFHAYHPPLAQQPLLGDRGHERAVRAQRSSRARNRERRRDWGYPAHRAANRRRGTAGGTRAHDRG